MFKINSFFSTNFSKLLGKYFKKINFRKTTLENITEQHIKLVFKKCSFIMQMQVIILNFYTFYNLCSCQNYFKHFPTVDSLQSVGQGRFHEAGSLLFLAAVIAAGLVLSRQNENIFSNNKKVEDHFLQKQHTTQLLLDNYLPLVKLLKFKHENKLIAENIYCFYILESQKIVINKLFQ